MNRFQFDEQELAAIRELQERVVGQYSSSEDPQLHQQLSVLAQELPPRLRQTLRDFRQSQPPNGIYLIGSIPINQDKIGPTPSHWKDWSDRHRTFEEQAFLLLFSALLGDAFGWSTLQDGRLVTDIFPIEEFADSQLGTSSRQPLYWHTEDAFHPFRADYVALLCLRNPDGIGTCVSGIDQIKLVPKYVRVLFEKRFLIWPDSSHLEYNQVASSTKDEHKELALQRMHTMRSDPEAVAVLFGDPAAPYLRIDPLMMGCAENDEEAHEALRWLTSSLESHLFEVVMKPGDVLLIDNFRAVHGRNKFSARFDGADRWLKRVLTSQDLSASRHWRLSPHSRVIG